MARRRRLAAPPRPARQLPGIVTVAVALSLLGAAPSARAAAHPDVASAFTVVGQWLDAQNRRAFDAYAALYADGFTGIKRTAKGAETTLDLAAWKADRKKMFAGKSLSVEIYGEQYGRDKDGTITVAFNQLFRSGSYGDQGFKILQMKSVGGALRITREEISNVKPLGPGAEVAGGTRKLDGVFPPSFASPVMAASGPCKNEVCTARLRLGAGKDQREVVLGTYQDNTDGEATGDYSAAIRAFTVVPFSTLRSGALVVLDNTPSGKPAELLARKATLVGGAPDYKVLWSGDLLAAPQGKGPRAACRAALIGSTDGGKPELLYSCGGAAPQVVALSPSGAAR